MYAKRLRYLKIPEEGREIGFDLMQGDWVEPFGKGLTGDLVFRLDGDQNWARLTEYERKISVNFSNEKDGLIPFEAGLVNEPGFEGSYFVSNYEAPETGYVSSWTQSTSRKAGQAHVSDYKPTRCFYFRVRSKLDEEGNLISAHYGKIYGDFMNFTYYINPTLNDRNIEFDPESNRFKRLEWKERVNRP